MKYLLILFALVLVINFTSCKNSTETPEPPVELGCSLDYIIRTDVSGLILEYGALRDTNDWKTFANNSAIGMENEFVLQYITPNPVQSFAECGFIITQNSKVKLYFNDSLFLDIYTYQGKYVAQLNLPNYPSGCYNLRAECYLGQTENSPISNKILTSSGRVMVIGRP